LDSLVRVTRRVVERHFVNILGPLVVRRADEDGWEARQLGCRTTRTAKHIARRPCLREARTANYLGLGQMSATRPVRPIPRGDWHLAASGIMSLETDVDPLDTIIRRCILRHNGKGDLHEASSRPSRSARHTTSDIVSARTGAHRFPVGNFTYCLTLSSECFSTFPHDTFTLSVSL